LIFADLFFPSVHCARTPGRFALCSPCLLKIADGMAVVTSIDTIKTGQNRIRYSSGLAPALEDLSKKTELHGALESAFNKLYGYTSDEDGIRHAILEEKEVGFDEAKYMIVACSAFVNFLISKAAATGLLATAAKK